MSTVVFASALLSHNTNDLAMLASDEQPLIAMFIQHCT